MVRIPVLILFGLLSAPLMELLSVIWMRTAPMAMDLTANYFAMVVLPAALVLHFVIALLLGELADQALRVAAGQDARLAEKTAAAQLHADTGVLRYRVFGCGRQVDLIGNLFQFHSDIPRGPWLSW